MTLTVDLKRSDANPARPLVAILLAAEEGLPDAGRKLDSDLGGALAGSLKKRVFRAGRDEVLHFAAGNTGNRVMLIGMGKGGERQVAVRRAAAVAARQARKLGAERLTIIVPDDEDSTIEACVIGANMGAWEYTDTRTPPPESERRAPLTSLTLLVADPREAREPADDGTAIARGIELARTLAMMPGNLCTPDFMATTARDMAKRHKLKVTVMGRKELEREKMGAFLAVAQGTPQEPRLIALEYNGGKGKPIVLVGKGLCFDSGGISIKPAQGMEWMKFDMCGAAGVLGAMEAIAALELPVNVVGIVGATTNMPSGTALKPGDVVQASSGKFIEIINTDAEGRLVLADLLHYASEFDPAIVVDAATLTGACVIALGHSATGVFGTDSDAVRQVLDAARHSGEPGWELPLWDDFKELIKSDVADVKNSGGRPAGSITAALFLKEFAEGYPWVHLDIAGTAYSESDLGWLPKGPTGIPVGTFVELVRSRAS
jgi:leucyl aminopeptidase